MCYNNYSKSGKTTEEKKNEKRKDFKNLQVPHDE